MMSTEVDKLLESVLYPVVTPIVRMPMYESLVNSIYQISSNAASIQTTISGGKIGYLVLTVSTTVYMTLSETYFAKLVNPSPAPSIPTNSTGIKQTAIRYKFDLDTELYLLLQNMYKTRKEQLLGSV